MKEKDREIYQEFGKYNGDSIAKYSTNTDRIFAIKENFKKCEENYKGLLRHYYILKLYEKTVYESEAFTNDFNLIKGYLDNFKKYFNDTKKVKQTITIDMPSNSIINAYYKVSDLGDIIDQLSAELRSFENHYYPKFKMSSYNIVKNKNKDEIEKLANEVNKFIDSFTSLEEAYDFVMYNSGEVITDTINELCSEINKKEKGSIDATYFIKEDMVVYIGYPDWVNLYSRLQYVFDRVDKNVLKVEKLDKMLKELEVRYVVVLIYNEKK